jgi:predicted transcriptional regulator
MNAKALMIDALIERVGTWPQDLQEEAIRSLLALEARHLGVYRLSGDERAAIEEGLDQADRGEFVSDEEVAAFFKHHGL